MTTKVIGAQAQADPTAADGFDWRSLYNLSGVSTLVLLAYSLATILIMVLTGGQPETVEGVFAMLQEDRLVGLLRLDLLTVLVMPLYYVVFLAFFMALRRVNLGYAALAALLVFAGLTLFLATPSVFSYLSLSDRYAAAASGAQRAQLLAAGEAIYASDMWRGTGAQVGGLLMQTGAVLVSVLMLKGNVFSKATGYVGIVTHGLDLAHVVVAMAAPAIGNIIMGAAGPLYLIWFPMIALRFFQLGRRSEASRPSHSLITTPGD